MKAAARSPHRPRLAITLTLAVVIAACVAGGLRFAEKGASSHDGPGQHASGGTLADLPLVETDAPGSGELLAVLITGDGGWASADRGLSQALAARGVPVVALVSPRYLARRLTPDECTRDLTRILRHYFAAWSRSRVIVIGYSRGADLAPFMVARLPEDLRRRVAAVALLGPSRWAGFQFHLIDLGVNIHRAGDLPVQQEIERLRGMLVLCIYGRRDHGAICPSLDTTLVHRVVRSGGHEVGGREGPALADTVLHAITLSTAEHRSRVRDRLQPTTGNAHN